MPANRQIALRATLDPAGDPDPTSEELWHRVYQTHGRSVYRFIASRIGAGAEAEDVLQETFVRVLRAGDRLRDLDRIRSYLFTTAANLIRNRFRRSRHLLFSELADDDGETWLDLPDESRASPEDESVLGEMEDRFRRALERLRPAHRRAFVAAVVEGRPYSEIAEREGWSAGQVRINVYRARRGLLERLDDLVRPEGDVT